MRRISPTRFSPLARLALLLLLVSMAACGSGPNPLPATPTPAPTATPTTPPAPTAPPTSTPIQAAALTSPGPWFLAEQSIRNYATGRMDRRLYAMSQDGGEWTSLNLPPIDETRYHWAYSIAPAGGHIALLAVRSDRALEIDPSGPAARIHILRLPENRVVREIPLLGEAGRAQVEKEAQNPVLAGLVTDEWNLRWSPDGRYLAYPSAAEGSLAAVALYDAQKDAIQPLAQSARHLVPWSWSPDGKTLLCQEIERVDRETRMPGARVAGVLRVSLKGETQSLYTAESMEQPLWLEPNRLLVYQIGPDTAKWNLRELNLATTGVRDLYAERFVGVSHSPSLPDILLNLGGNANPASTEQSGIYRLNLDTLQRSLFIPCAYCDGRWDPVTKQIQVERYWEENEGISFYDGKTGQETAHFPKDFTGVLPAPDGKRLLLYGYDRSLLLDSAFQVVKELPGDVPNGQVWNSKSTGFFSEEAGSIVFYSQENDWQPVPLRDVEGGFSWSVVQP